MWGWVALVPAAGARLTGHGFKKLCLGRQGDPKIPSGGQRPQKRRAPGPLDLADHSSRTANAAVWGAVREGPAGPSCPGCHTALFPQGPPAPWQGAQRTEAREATGHPSLPTRSTGGRGRARQRRPDEAQRQRGVRHSARLGSGDPALQRHPTRGLEVTSLGHTSAILTQARAMGSDCTGNCRPPWTDISGRTTQWPKRRQRRLGPPLESGAPARPPPWLARRSVFHLPVGDRTCSPAQLLTRPPQT